MNERDRMLQVMQAVGMNAKQFCQEVGISPGTLSNITGGRNKPSLEVVMKIHKACSYVNLPWLLYGEGEMEELANDPILEDSAISGVMMLGESPLFASNGAEDCENRKEMELRTPVYAPKEIVREEVKYIEKPARKITEIRIFFDNGTYETFRPDKQG